MDFHIIYRPFSPHGNADNLKCFLLFYPPDWLHSHARARGLLQLPNTCHILRLVRRELSKLKPGKATGLDGIPQRLLKDALAQK